MDFMKVFDQTVREIKREVNLKVLKVPEIEQKVLDATDNEPWGPHGTALAEIAQATKKFSECQLVMNVIWTRLGETGKDWRYVYKALAVIEYLISHGSERAVDEIIEHTFQISSLTCFEYVEPSGKDMGINVRKKAENIVSLLNDKDRIQEARNKAASNQNKFVGLSSSSIAFKSGASSYGSGSSYNGDRYGSSASSYEDSYNKKDSYGEEMTDSDTYGKSRQGTSEKQRNASKESERDSEKRFSSKSSDSVKGSERTNVVSSSDADDFDDFDPRGTSNSKPMAAEGAKQIDLFGQSLIDDLLDKPIAVAAEVTAMNPNSSEVDLFADADFVSASNKSASGANTQAKVDLFASQHSVTPAASMVDRKQVDLFASQPGISPTASSTANLEQVDLFASPPISSPAASTTVDLFASDSAVKPETKVQNSDPIDARVVDPFAAVPLNNFDGSDLFGSFSCNSDVGLTEPTHSTVSADNPNSSSSKPSENSKLTQKKDNFQVKSGIWADSLSRGLIDLNISAPKKVSLAEVGVVGLTETDERNKGPPASLYMGRAMGGRSVLGGTGFTHAQTVGLDDFFSSQQSQFGSFKK